MAEDYYEILGVSRGASADEIQKAYREQARKYHPDMNPDDESAKAKFQSIQTAYEVLNDPKKRELFDKYGPGFEQMTGGSGPFGGQPGHGPWRAENDPSKFDNVDWGQFFGEQPESGGGFSDLFRQFTGRSSERRGSRPRPRRGSNIAHELQVPFRTAVSGGEAQLSVRRQTGKVEAITVKIPAGIDDGKKIRLRGQGEPGDKGGTAGDIIITVRVATHPFYQRVGRDLVVRTPLTLSEAILGAKVDVPSPYGIISLTVPPGTSSGKRLRIPGHGVRTRDRKGDLFAEMQIVLPESVDEMNESTRQSLTRLDELYQHPPRQQLTW